MLVEIKADQNYLPDVLHRVMDINVSMDKKKFHETRKINLIQTLRQY